MPTYRDQAVVLRTHNLGEADRIITVLSREHGKVRAVAKGVRRTLSKFGSRLEPFTQVDVQFATGRSLDVIVQAESMTSFGRPMAADFAMWTVGQVMVETADRLVSEEREPALQQYQLLVGALRVLTSGTSDGPRAPTLILDSYLLRALAHAGWAPSFTDCARCGLAGSQRWFTPVHGGVVCDRCKPPGASRPDQETLELLAALLEGRWEATRQVSAPVAKRASTLVSAYAAWHLERGLRSLKHVERR